MLRGERERGKLGGGDTVGRVTNCTKSNAPNYSMVFWDEVYKDVSAAYPDVAKDAALVDAITMWFIKNPEGSTSSSPPTSSGTPSPTWERCCRAEWDRRRGQHQPRTHLPLDVRADPRLGTEVHRDAAGQPDRLDRGGADDARPRRLTRCGVRDRKGRRRHSGERRTPDRRHRRQRSHG